jgi:hypothetical protein
MGQERKKDWSTLEETRTNGSGSQEGRPLYLADTFAIRLNCCALYSFSSSLFGQMELVLAIPDLEAKAAANQAKQRTLLASNSGASGLSLENDEDDNDVEAAEATYRCRWRCGWCTSASSCDFLIIIVEYRSIIITWIYQLVLILVMVLLHEPLSVILTYDTNQVGDFSYGILWHYSPLMDPQAVLSPALLSLSSIACHFKTGSTSCSLTSRAANYFLASRTFARQETVNKAS